MSTRYEPSVELACPHDGWYNGNPRLMIQNGTYADYRYRLEEWVKRGKMHPNELAKWDKQWDAIQLPEKKRRRNQVIVDSSPVPKMVNKKIEMLAKPSDNGVPPPSDAPAFRKPQRARLPAGSIANRPDPLAAEEAAVAAKNLSSNPADTSPGSTGVGRPIPAFVPPSPGSMPPATPLMSAAK